jgi:hypothetical protein
VPFTKTFNPGEILTAADANDFLLNQGYQYRETIYYTSSDEFVKADFPWLKAIRVRCVGGGGGGGGAGTTASNTIAIGSNGAGGNYAESFITDIAGLDASVTVTRGAGGAASAAGVSNGGAGDTSSFGSLVVAGGGGGGFGNGAGTVPSWGAGAPAPSATATGDLVIFGDSPDSPNRIALFFVLFPKLAGSFLSGSPRQDGTGNGVNGNAGQLFGGGGGGGGNANSQGTNRSGGAGGNGIVIVDLFG